MRHLTRDQLLDLVEAQNAEASGPHLRSCATCRQELKDLRNVIDRVADVAVPEPSPLFWDHFSARVGEAVGSEPPGTERPIRDSRRWWGYGLPIATMVVVLLVAASVVTSRRATVAVPSVQRDAPIALEASDVFSAADQETTLGLVADLGRDLDWDDLHDGGVIVHDGLLERAVNGLSAGERAELGRLLKQELSGGGD
jgi:hypothetical protein